MASHEKIELLRVDDQIAVEFCAEYLSAAWNESLDAARARLLKYARGENREFCCVARIDDVPIGMMACFSRTALNTDGIYEPWPAGLFVTQQWRNRGIGARILVRVQEEARNRGFEKVHLATDKEHLKKWYRRLGWRRVGRAFDEEHDYDVFCFDLSNAAL